ncbi:NAD(P) transhydrogenase subunit alpha [Streptomyces sp. 4N509B]|uniref:NAD(P) transhydrogenase subunit alpha n=1 Tax=Streptomyces sp. 4N509B TaxID=3457413 RepID=UPI003FD4644E
MAETIAGVIRERAPAEHRVALVPEAVARLRPAGVEVLVEAGAGEAAWCPDEAYEEAGAAVVPRAELYRRADVLLCVGPPDESALAHLREGQTLIGMLEPRANPDAVAAWAERGVTAVSLDLLPRTLSRAQSMDALTSQANIAGYRAVLVAAAAYPRYFPMLTTAAGTAPPAQVLVLGTGVAGLQAIATSRRLGAVVSAYDVRPEARDEVASLGARFLDVPGISSGSGEGGYARALRAEEEQLQQRTMEEYIGRSDVVITTARVPGRRPPVLVTKAALDGMRPGSVVVDMAAGPLGGNVELSRPETTEVLPGGVTLIGAGNLPSTMATAASTAYARNVTALLTHLLSEGTVRVDLDDEIQDAVVVTHDCAVRAPGGPA